MPRSPWRRGIAVTRRLVATTAVVLATCSLLCGCLGDGVHLSSGLYYSAGSRGGQTCTYGTVEDDVDAADIEQVDTTADVVALAVDVHQAAPGTGGRYLRVSEAEEGFVSEGCDNWMPVGTINPVLAPGAPVPVGMFRLGHDVVAGTWTSAGGPSCEWSLLADATAKAGVIDSGRGAGPHVIDIDRGDDGFLLNSGCAPFERVGAELAGG